MDLALCTFFLTESSAAYGGSYAPTFSPYKGVGNGAVFGSSVSAIGNNNSSKSSYLDNVKKTNSPVVPSSMIYNSSSSTSSPVKHPMSIGSHSGTYPGISSLKKKSPLQSSSPKAVPSQGTSSSSYPGLMNSSSSSSSVANVTGVSGLRPASVKTTSIYPTTISSSYSTVGAAEDYSARSAEKGIPIHEDYTISSKSPLRERLVQYYQLAVSAMESITSDPRTKCGYEKVMSFMTSLHNEIVLYRRHIAAGGLLLPDAINEDENFADKLLSSADLLSDFKVKYRGYEVAVTSQEVGRSQLKLAMTNVLHTEFTMKNIMENLESRMHSTVNNN